MSYANFRSKYHALVLRGCVDEVSIRTKRDPNTLLWTSSYVRNDGKTFVSPPDAVKVKTIETVLEDYIGDVPVPPRKRNPIEILQNVYNIKVVVTVNFSDMYYTVKAHLSKEEEELVVFTHVNPSMNKAVDLMFTSLKHHIQGLDLAV